MRQHQPDRDGDERMQTAAANLKRILNELAGYQQKPRVEEISTAGTWRSSDDQLPQLSTE
jgi:hypothetical protein